MLRHTPHAVTLHFRGLRPIGVSPYWLGDPGRALYNSNELRAIRYSCRSIGHSAETKQLLSCGCAHFRAFPNVARRPHRRLLRRAHNGSTSDSHGVSSPSTHQPERVYSTPACRTGYVPSSGFRTLSTACSSLGRPALFHASNVHGVLPFRGFPSPSGPVGSSPGDSPPGVSPPIAE